jgi:hypothetical protein
LWASLDTGLVPCLFVKISCRKCDKVNSFHVSNQLMKFTSLHQCKLNCQLVKMQVKCSGFSLDF